jgi:hypothetical protein
MMAATATRRGLTAVADTSGSGCKSDKFTDAAADGVAQPEKEKKMRIRRR